MFTSADSDIHQKRFDFELRSSPLVATTSDFIIPDGEFRWSRSDFSLALTQVVATTPEFLLCDPGFAHVADLRGGNAPHEGQEGLYIGDDTRIYLPQERTPGFLPYATRLEHYAADYWALPSNDWSPTLVRIIASKSVEVNGRPALLQIYQTGTVSSDGMFSVNEYDADLDLRIVLFEGERSLIVATRRADEDGLEQLARVASCVIWR